MLTDILKQIGWIDVLVAILFVRICYIAVKNGFSTEFFKFLGTLLAIYLSLHYYTALSDFVQKRFTRELIPLEFLDFICFVLLAEVGYLLFFILRATFLRLVTIEAVSMLNHWGGLLIGIARSLLFIGIVIYALTISSVSYFKDSVARSYLGKAAIKTAPAVYSGLWNGFFSKFMAQEKFNQYVTDTQNSLTQ